MRCDEKKSKINIINKIQFSILIYSNAHTKRAGARNQQSLADRPQNYEPFSGNVSNSVRREMAVNANGVTHGKTNGGAERVKPKINDFAYETLAMKN